MFTIAPEGRGDPMVVYLGLMEEIKQRLLAIRTLTAPSPLPPQIARDSCFLQLRMICEAVAVGCLIAHGKNVGTLSRRLEKHWSAEQIMKDLEKLNPHFFPIAINFSREPILETTDIQPPPIEKGEFIKMYARFGDSLHRGSLERLSEQIENTPNIRMDDIVEAASRLRRLLQIHRMGSVAHQRGFLCNIENTPGGEGAILTYENLPLRQ